MRDITANRHAKIVRQVDILLYGLLGRRTICVQWEGCPARFAHNRLCLVICMERVLAALWQRHAYCGSVHSFMG